MVAAVSATAASRHHKHPSPPRRRDDLRRPPLTPSEKDNAATAVAAAAAAAAAPRRPRTKEISSRYLSSYSTLSSSSTSTSNSTNTTFSSSSSSCSLSSRRFPSPLVTPRPSTPPALPQSATSKRSHSVDRVRPSTPRAAAGALSPAEPSAAARALCTTTRSLSVSFQGESFFYQTSRAKATSPSPARKPTPERRRANAGAPTLARAGDHSENARPLENHHHRWPAAARVQAPNPLRRSLDCSSEIRDPIFTTVRLLQQSMVFDDRTRRASFEGTDLSASSDTESVSSGSNSGATEYSFTARAKATPRGISVPARFWQDTGSRLRRLPELTSPLSSPGAGSSVQPKLLSVKKLSMDNLSSSPRANSSPLRGPIRPSSPARVADSHSRSAASPLRVRSSTSASGSPVGQPANAPSIISFAAEVRRAKKGENRIEEAHLLRLFDNRHLQWRTANARVNTALLQQKLTAEKNLCNAWITTSELRDSVTIKRIKLQLLTQNLKLTSILKWQMAYLEEWSLLEREHSSSLSGATEALRASTLRLPVGGAKADIQEVKDAIGSAVDVMQAMASSIRSLLSKVEGRSSLISEIAAVAAQERALLDRSRDLLSTVAAMHVTQCSLKGHIIQLKRKASQMQV